ncbi:MAG: hypothetical protein QM756_35440 [Polyangiaceae bacterium]
MGFRLRHFRVPKDGSEGPEELVSDLNQVASLSVNATSLSFSMHFSQGGVGYCPLSGCAGAVSLLGSDQPFPYSIASDQANLYWINASIGGSDKPASVMRSAFAEPNPIQIDALPAPSLAADQMIATDDTHVYWVSSGKAGVMVDYVDSSIRRARKVW